MTAPWRPASVSLWVGRRLFSESKRRCRRFIMGGSPKMISGIYGKQKPAGFTVSGLRSAFESMRTQSCGIYLIPGDPAAKKFFNLHGKPCRNRRAGAMCATIYMTYDPRYALRVARFGSCIPFPTCNPKPVTRNIFQTPGPHPGARTIKTGTQAERRIRSATLPITQRLMPDRP